MARGRKLFGKLMVAALLTLLPVSLLWIACGAYYVRQVQEANTLLLQAAEVRRLVLEVRRAEKDILLRDIYRAEYYATGAPAENVAKHAARLAELGTAVQALAAQLPAAQRAQAAELTTSIDHYAAAFTALRDGLRERGWQEHGCAGAVNAAGAALQAAARQPALLQEVYALRLAEKNYVLQEDSSSAAAVVAGVARVERLAAAAPADTSAAARAGAESLAGAVRAYREAFDRHLALQQRIGYSENDGLQGEMRAAIHAVDAELQALDSIHAAASTAAAAAGSGLLRAGVLLMLFGLFLGTLIFWLAARVLLRPVQALQDATTELAAGKLGARAAVAARDEFGLLAQAFNAMAEALTAVVRGVQRAGVHVLTSANEISASSRQLAAAVSEQTAATAQVGASAREIAATAQDLVGTVTHVAERAQQGAHLAERNRDEVTAMAAAINELVAATGTLAGQFALLREKAGSIGAVVTTIGKVADQTNLLSLNAAIEAEKAGAAGQGFAVVAREIRRLADQSAQATGDIEEIIREVQGAVAAGTTGMERFTGEVKRHAGEVARIGGNLGTVISTVQEFAPLCGTVNEGVRAQAAAAGQIDAAMTQLAESARQSQEAAASLTAVAGQLTDAARELQGEVSRFST